MYIGLTFVTVFLDIFYLISIVLQNKNILLFSEEKLKTKPKKAKQSLASKRLAQAIPLDATGRPIFPIALGGLKVHSLGEVSN